MSEINNTLPAGKTCRDCFHFIRCNAMGWSVKAHTVCDFDPSRFVDASQVPKATLGDGDGMAKIVSDREMSASHRTALRTLWDTGLSPHRYTTIEQAAEGAAGIIRCLRAHLDNPPPDVQEKVLKMHDGSLNAGLANENARLREALAKNWEAARASFVLCPALDDIKDQCEDALKGGKP